MGLLGNLITGAANSVFGSMLGGASQAVNDKRAHEYRMEEQEHSMKLQKDYQDWLNKNAFKDQMQSVIGAGMNPMFMEGSVPGTPGLGTPSAGSGSGASASYAPMDLLTKSQIDLIDSQKDKTKAEEKKIEEETIGQQNENRVFDTKFMLEKGFTEAQIDNLDASSSKAIEEINSLVAGRNLTWIEVRNKQREIDSQIELNLNQSVYYRGMNHRQQEQLESAIKQMLSVAEYNEAAAGSAKAQEGLINSSKALTDWIVKNKEDFGNTESVVSMVTGVINSVANVISAVGSVVPKPKIGK